MAIKLIQLTVKFQSSGMVDDVCSAWFILLWIFSNTNLIQPLQPLYHSKLKEEIINVVCKWREIIFFAVVICISSICFGGILRLVFWQKKLYKWENIHSLNKPAAFANKRKRKKKPFLTFRFTAVAKNVSKTHVCMCKILLKWVLFT